ncbi:MAG: leucine-rich repeat protein [Faecousia sp.]
MKTPRRLLSIFLVLILCLSPATVWAAPAYPQPDYVVELNLSDPVESLLRLQKDALTAAYEKDDWVTVIVELEEAPVLAGAESPAVLQTAAGQAQTQSLLTAHQALQAKILRLPQTAARSAGHGESTVREYTAIFNGFSMEICYGDVEALRQMAGVENVYLDNRYEAPAPVETGLAPMMAGSTEGIGSNLANEMGYDGDGMVVAILDSGLDTDHEAFSKAPENPALSMEDLEDVLDDLNAYPIDYPEDVYVSEKIPYAYDYASNAPGADAVADTNGHGTHVAGTVAGNNGKDFYGVAPNAQLLIMKVIAPNGSIYDSVVLSALEDAVTLGADAVNMSLGASAGFSDSKESPLYPAYKTCSDMGISLMIAAGNDANSAIRNQYGNNLPLAESPDTALVSTPSTTYAALSVASVENFKTRCFYMKQGETEIQFNNAVDYDNGGTFDFSKMLCDSDETVTLDYVVVPGLGSAEDYEALFEKLDLYDLEDLVVVVPRGQLTFFEKAYNAFERYALGCIIYNNEDGPLIPALQDPESEFSEEDEDKLDSRVTDELIKNGFGVAGISKADGQKLIDAADSDGFGQLTVSTKYVDYRPIGTSGKPSSFSDWGPTPDLKLKPEIAAPGGEINSARPGGGYQVMSGTSMASPHMAGAAAVMRQYLREAHGITDSNELESLTAALLMSTAQPALREDGAPYSPRQQGAGVVNLESAITTQSYLTVEGCDRPKAELGDSDAGVYAFTLQVHNMGDVPLTYVPGLSSVTEGVAEEKGVAFIDMVTTALVAGTDYTVAYTGLTDGKLTVPANGEASLAVAITLTESRKNQIRKDFPNGNYVEGYLTLTPQGEGVTLGLPYLGFYGDWEKAPLFDGLADEAYYMSPTELIGDMTDAIYYQRLGMSYSGEYDYSKLAFSSAEYDLISIPGLRRNAVDMTFSVLKGDEVIWEANYDRMCKNFFSSSSAGVTRTVMSEGWDGTLEDGTAAPEGSYIYRIIGCVAQFSVTQTQEIPFVLDNTAPTTSDFSLTAEDGRYYLEFDVRDEHFVNYIQLGDSTSSTQLAVVGDGFAEITEPGALTRVRIDITNLGDLCAKNGLNPARISVFTTDYAGNTAKDFVDIGPRAITLDNLSLEVGSTARISYTIRPDGLQEIPLAWVSSDETVATVDETGLVTGLRNGTAVVSASAVSGLTAKCVVTVGTGITSENLQNNFGETPYLNERFQSGDFWYKVTGPDTVQLIRDPNSGWSGYPDLYGPITIPAEATYENVTFRVTSIGQSAFSSNSDITSVELPDTLEIIGPYAFEYCYGVEITELPDSIHRIDDAAFKYASSVNCNIPSNLEVMGSEVFNGSGLTHAVIPATVARLGDEAFSSCYHLTEVEFQGVPQEMGEGVFSYDSALEKVTLPQGLPRIPAETFMFCSGLKDVQIPETVSDIGNSAFLYSGITSIVIPEACREIGVSAFAGTTSRKIRIPDQVERIEDRAFESCSGVETIVIGKSVSFIGDSVFNYMTPAEGVDEVHIEVISESAASALFCSGYHGVVYKDGLPYVVYSGLPFQVDGVTYRPTSDRTVMVISCYGHEGDDLTIPETVYSENDDMTYTVTAVGRAGLTNAKGNVTLPETVTRIGELAFWYASEATSINLPQGLTVIQEEAFMGMGSEDAWEADTLTVPGGVGTFGAGAFSETPFRKAVLTEGITQVSARAFEMAQNLEEVILPNTVARIGHGAFAYCDAIESIRLPEALERIDDEAFYNTSLTEISIPTSVRYVGSNAFAGTGWDEDYNEITTGPATVSIGGGLKDLGWNSFRSDADITTVLNSQRNLCVTFGDLEKVPTVIWDGETRIPLGDGSCVPEGVEITLAGDVTIDGKLCLEGKVIVPANVQLTIGENALIVNPENIIYEACDHSETELRDAKEATCTEDGYTGDEVCTVCGETLKKGEVIPAHCASKVFTDLRVNQWYHPYTDYVIDNGLMKGVGGGKFNPNGKTTRAMLVTTLYRLAGEPEVAELSTFTDVPANQWYAKAVAWAQDLGIANGVTDTTFCPNASVTREQAASFLYRYVTLYLKAEPVKGADLSVYKDADSISGYAKEAIAWATAEGLFEGFPDGTMQPKGTLTRAQMAKLLTVLDQKF